MQLPHISGVIFHREGGLQLTKRFEDGQWPVIDPASWREDCMSTSITFSSGSVLESPVAVRQFSPCEGDVTGRYWTDARGDNHWIELPAYAVTDPEAYLFFLHTKIPTQARVQAAHGSDSHQEALRLANLGMAPELQTLLCYDFGRAQKTRSAFLTGDQMLGIAALPADSETLPGCAPLPRMITAQCDSIMSTYLAGLLTELFGQGDGVLSRRIRSRTPLDTHISYVALRILVQGTLWILLDKFRRNQQNSTNDHSLELRLQDSLNRLIANFGEVHRGIDYDELTDELDGESLMYHADIRREAQQPEAERWTNAVFWLPPLSVMLRTPWEAKAMFHF